MANHSAFLLSLYFFTNLFSVNLAMLLNTTSTDTGGQINKNSAKTFDEYLRTRNDLIESELELSFGSDIKLTEKEERANRIIMAAKETELDIGLHEPHRFNPARHIVDALDDIKRSKLFQIIRKMPKGGILHTHEMAMCSTDFVVSLTYWPDLWQRTANADNKIQEFLFSREQPMVKEEQSNSTWRLVSTVRTEMSAPVYDARLRELLTLFKKNVDPKLQFNDVFDIWPFFKSIFDLVTPILRYVPARKAYFKQALRDMLKDGVQYMEFRCNVSKFQRVYDINGTIYDNEDLIAIFMEVLNEFKRENPSFIGSKLIYGGNKWLNKNIIESFFKVIRSLHAKYPSFVSGFDLFNLEDKSPKLVSFAEQILQLPKDIQLVFHAGETNWFGSIDENLFDAILLGSRRIGHGYALAKHPKLMKLVKSKNIAIEVNPISNQVLRFVDDFRNHPASIYLAHNIPIVISSDDPGFWEVTPLSHDFYVTFLGIASRHSDLRTLKKLATNSIEYSTMNAEEKIEAMAKWQTEWHKFIDDLVNEQ